jgi:hypothetical protein
MACWVHETELYGKKLNFLFFENVNQSFSFYNLLAYGNELLYYEKENHEQKEFINKSMK